MLYEKANILNRMLTYGFPFSFKSALLFMNIYGQSLDFLN